jgi:hypothetical protein
MGRPHPHPTPWARASHRPSQGRTHSRPPPRPRSTHAPRPGGTPGVYARGLHANTCALPQPATTNTHRLRLLELRLTRGAPTHTTSIRRTAVVIMLLRRGVVAAVRAAAVEGTGRRALAAAAAATAHHLQPRPGAPAGNFPTPAPALLTNAAEQTHWGLTHRRCGRSRCPGRSGARCTLTCRRRRPRCVAAPSHRRRHAPPRAVMLALIAGAAGSGR